jgi:hypothetical protein
MAEKTLQAPVMQLNELMLDLRGLLSLELSLAYHRACPFFLAFLKAGEASPCLMTGLLRGQTRRSALTYQQSWHFWSIYNRVKVGLHSYRP